MKCLIMAELHFIMIGLLILSCLNFHFTAQEFNATTTTTLGCVSWTALLVLQWSSASSNATRVSVPLHLWQVQIKPPECCCLLLTVFILFLSVFIYHIPQVWVADPSALLSQRSARFKQQWFCMSINNCPHVALLTSSLVSSDELVYSERRDKGIALYIWCLSMDNLWPLLHPQGALRQITFVMGDPDAARDHCAFQRPACNLATSNALWVGESR